MSEVEDMAARRMALQDTLFLALTRPAMMFGVPAVGLMINLCGSLILSSWVGMGTWHIMVYFLVLAPSIHMVMRFAVAKDHNIFRTKILSLETKGRSSDSEEWGGSALTPLPSHWPTKASDIPISYGGEFDV